MTSQTDQPSVVTRILQSPVPWGLAFSTVFYIVVPSLPNFAEWGQTLFCGHPLAYATTVLFWIGISALGIAWRKLPAERQAVQARVDAERVSGQPVATAERLLERLNRQPEELQNSRAFERLRGIAEFVHGRRSSEGLTGHLEYLAGFAGERLHNSFALVRTITWAVPILGFLGTVIGITQAISNLDPAKLESSFGLVAGGLGVAFGTTALSLGLSLLLVFGTYLVEKQERLILADVELLGVSVMTNLFAADSVPASPLAEASQESARQLLEQTEQLIQQQVALWQESLDDLRTRWASTMQQQAAHCQASLDDLQTRWASTMQQQAAGLNDSVRETQTALHQTLTETLQSHRQLLTGHRDLITERREAQAELVQTLEQLATTQTESAAAQRLLAKQLESDRRNSSLDETLHTLTAAIHLLSARAGSRAA